MKTIGVIIIGLSLFSCRKVYTCECITVSGSSTTKSVATTKSTASGANNFCTEESMKYSGVSSCTVSLAE